MSTFIAFRFPGGRYHATPWVSHANEAEVEWPPSPWRILRALVATWHRKLSPDRFPEDVLAALIERLATVAPVYRLPPAVRAHSRHYMPVRTGAADRPVLIFDAFAQVDRDTELVVAWPGVTLNYAARELLAALAESLAYLGRAESWVEARVLDRYDGTFNSGPSGSIRAEDGSWTLAGEPEGAAGASPTLPGTAPESPASAQASADPVDAGERAVPASPLPESRQPALVPVRLLVPIPADAYAEWRGRVMAEAGLDAKRLTRVKKLVKDTLPERLIDALRIETGDLRAAGWNLPPGGSMAAYERPRFEAGRPSRTHRVRSRQAAPTTARLALAGKPLPRIEDAVRIGELARVAAMHHAQRVVGDGPVPAELSGHDLPTGDAHAHAFYLPEDADGDGRVDHILIHAPGGLSRTALAALDRIRRIWDEDGQEWQTVLESYGDGAGAVRSSHAGPGRVWQSVTPYLHPWFAKKRFGVADQVARECRGRGLPEPVRIERLLAIRIRERDRRPVHFHRFRSRRGLVQPDTKGSFLRITFPAPVDGPLALGFGCHYGLGMFRSAEV